MTFDRAAFRGLACALAIAACGAACATGLPSRWVARDVGSLGDFPVTARGVDVAGRVVGISRRADTIYVHAFATGPDGVGLVDLCPAAAFGCDAQAISAHGVVVGGYLDDDAGAWAAFAVQADGSAFRTLPTLGGTGYTIAHAINDLGQVAGESQTGSGDDAVHAFSSSRDESSLHDIGARGDPADDSVATAINAGGQVAGLAVTRRGDWHAMAALALHGKPRDLGTLGGSASAATGIAPDGLVVGWADAADGTWRAFTMSTGDDGPMNALGTLGGSSSEANAVNALGHLVGEALVRFDDAWHAFVADAAEGRLVDLNRHTTLPPGVVLVGAQAINDRDQIAAAGSDGHTYLLTPAGR